MPVDAFNNTSNTFNCLHHHVGITNIRHIFYNNSLVRHNGSCQDCKGRILSAAYLHLSHQRITTLYCILFHHIPLYKSQIIKIIKMNKYLLFSFEHSHNYSIL